MAEASQPVEEEAAEETATPTLERGMTGVIQMPIKKATQAQIVGSARTQGIRRKPRIQEPDGRKAIEYRIWQCTKREVTGRTSRGRSLHSE